LISVQQSERFKTLGFENQQIIAALLNLQSTVAGDFQVQLRTLSVLLDRTNIVIADQEDRTRKLIVDVFQLALQSNYQDEKLGKVQASEKSIRRKVSNEILDSLLFPSILERFEGVAEAHERTCQWIFQNPSNVPNEELQDELQKQWSDFPHWLRHDGGVYWISGKTGSGKSTLMKYIFMHPALKQNLKVWQGMSAECPPLYTAGFFFWAAGTSLQKSQSGLLRSVLHDALEQNLNLIPVVFPKQWSAHYAEKLSPSSSRRFQVRYNFPRGFTLAVIKSTKSL